MPGITSAYCQPSQSGSIDDLLMIKEEDLKIPLKSSKFTGDIIGDSGGPVFTACELNVTVVPFVTAICEVPLVCRNTIVDPDTRGSTSP